MNHFCGRAAYPRGGSLKLGMKFISWCVRCSCITMMSYLLQHSAYNVLGGQVVPNYYHQQHHSHHYVVIYHVNRYAQYGSLGGQHYELVHQWLEV